MPTKRQDNEQWKIRIIGHGEEAPDQLLANPRNWRLHPQYQQDALKSVLRSVGIVDTIIVNQRTGFVVDGHLRVVLAISEGQKTIPITYVDLSEDEEKLILASFDPIAAMAAADREQLGELLKGIEAEDESVRRMLEAIAKDNKIPFGITEGLTDDDDIPEEVETICKTGDLWQLGDHRLLCGDATKKEDVERLMQGEKAEAVITDPPYGFGKYETDRAPNMDFYNWLISYPVQCAAFFGYPEKLIEICIALCRCPDEWITWYPPNKTMAQFEILCKVAECIAIFGDMNEWANLRRERTETGRRLASMVGNRDIETGKEHDVWCDPSPGTMMNAHLRLHPNQKPVSLMEKLIQLCSGSESLVLDPFGGSGTTLIACEKLGRKCRMMEISEMYCDVIRTRWEQFTGKQAVKL